MIDRARVSPIHNACVSAKIHRATVGMMRYFGNFLLHYLPHFLLDGLSPRDANLPAPRRPRSPHMRADLGRRAAGPVSRLVHNCRMLKWSSF